MSNAQKITKNDQRDLVIQAGMQLIPYVGGSLSSLYFGAKQEKRFKRLESFYQEIASEIEKIQDSISSVDKQDPVALEAIIESLHEKVEAEPTLEKREFFKNYFKNTLKFPVAGNFDERKYFLDALSEMTLLECELLAFINSQPNSIQVDNIQKQGTDQYAVVGAVGRLKSRGFLTATPGSFAVGGGADNSLQEMVSVSSFGKLFIAFCLNT
jgi:hypothetical protein